MKSSGVAFLQFLDAAVTSGVLRPAHKTSAKHVLMTALGSAWGNTDIATLDVDETLARFEAVAAATLARGSVDSYKSRFRRAVGEFQARLERGSGPSATPAEMLEYPLPLRNGVVARLHLPADLTVNEAGRIADHVSRLPLTDSST